MDKFIIDSFRGYFYYLSNFYPCNVTVNGIEYESSEAAFQAQKCINPEDRLQFSKLSPRDAKRLGKSIPLRPDWEEVKLDIMKGVLIAKFSQNPDLKLNLLNTENATLIEGNTWGDTYWGVCDGTGENHLGKLLMEIRTIYKEGIINTTKDVRTTKVVFCFLTSNDVNDELNNLCYILGSRNMKVFMNDAPKHGDKRMVHVGFNLDYEISREELNRAVSSIGSGIASRTTTPTVVLPGDNLWRSIYNNM